MHQPNARNAEPCSCTDRVHSVIAGICITITLVQHHHSADPVQTPVSPAALAKALALVVTWYALSTTLSLYNKYVIGHKYGVINHEPFPAPMLLSAAQFGLQYALARLVHACGARRTLGAGPLSPSAALAMHGRSAPSDACCARRMRTTCSGLALAPAALAMSWAAAKQSDNAVHERSPRY